MKQILIACCLVLYFTVSCEGISPVDYPVEITQQCGQNTSALSEQTLEVLQNVKVRLQTFVDCKDAFEKGHTTSGVYTINPDNQKSFQVYCDMDTDGGGWTVFQRRMDGSVDFNRNWVDYEEGFGNTSGEYWLGLKDIHCLTTSAPQELRVNMEDFESNIAYAHYNTFNVSGASDKYRLLVSGYSGTAGDSLTRQSTQQFTTKDQDNDLAHPNNCAVLYKGGWWYENCHASNLNGLYLNGNYKGTYANGIDWSSWKGYFYSLKKVEMKMRRK